MKNNLLFLIALAFCATACAGVRSRPPAPFKMSDEAKTPGERDALYQKYRVVKTDGLLSQIRDDYYSAAATVKYFEKSAATEAAEVAQQAIDLNHFGKKIEYGSLIAGGVLGLGGGLLVAQQYAASHPFESSDFHTNDAVPPLIFILGGLAGAIVGELTGWSIYHWHYYAKAKEMFGGAGDSFNRYLGGQLGLEISPAPGGAAGVIKFTY